ncbi:MAG: arginine--tRNA ligase [Candidatus Buchananbacteria bacterium CG10_big_fil_rev_8_21_14_0_10_42_9]|uniref:Arginine--tRNA ligase n=1 Tax=Candidatus Buchananbacteria bacterium CG10_big_fil_rev_8_21_14_0_10_42_9 TaxID=1974526 RepID=A0A2H0W0Z1_9BACT|nr:MAG: arginine--tRNA ligase [Candidatus Buchananbacteria bacterium CG10_big_fil_rev_8_21_14_0_10_42_9]
MTNHEQTCLSVAEEEAYEDIHAALKKLLGKNYTKAPIIIGYPPSPELGDFAVPLFHLAKELKRKPQQLAEKLAAEFKPTKYLSAARAAGGYLNFYADKPQFAELILMQILHERSRYGNNECGGNQKVMLEYSQPNTHKEFHIGHLRNTVLGISLTKILQANDYQVIQANYIGDTGAHIAKSLWLLQQKDFNEFKQAKNKGKALGQNYSEAVNKLEDRPEAKLDVSEIHRKLENGNPELTKLWQETREWSLDEFKEIYKELGANFDVYYFESEVEDDGKKLVQELLDKKILQESEGAIIADLEQYGLGVLILLKSDGTASYATKDLPLAIKKAKQYKLDQSLYQTDNRQSLYFKQIFKILQLAGFKPALKHLPYEFVNLKEGAMSSRKGNIVSYSELRDKVLDQAVAETQKRHPDWDGKRVMKSARAITMAALKFDMLKQNKNSVITFDPEAALQFTGDTGPYVQYTHARISSILQKVKKPVKSKVDFSVFKEVSEVELIKMLGQFPLIVKKAADEFEPAEIARYLIDISQAFSSFYESIPILKSSPKEQKARLLLVNGVKTTLAKGLNLLGIEAPEEM